MKKAWAVTFVSESCSISLSFLLFLIAISEFQKNKFSNWKTLLFAKWKTRSANYGFRQSKRLSDWLFLRILLHFHCLSLLFFDCDSWIPKKTGFPIGKHYFLQSGKRVQQTMVLDSPNGCPNYLVSEFHSISLSFSCCLVMISEFHKSKFPNWETLLFAKW